MKEAEVLQTEIVRDIVRELDIELNRLAESLTLITEHPVIRNMDIDNQTEILNQYVNLSPLISTLFVMNKTGWFVSATVENLTIYTTSNYRSLEPYITTFERGEIYFSPPESYYNNTLVSTFMSVPIVSDTGEKVGILFGVMKLNDLMQRISNYPLNEDQILYVVDKYGRVVGHSEINLFTLEEGPLSLNYSSRYLVQEIMSGGKSGIHEYIINGTSTIGVNMVVESSGWGVIVEAPRDKILFESRVLAQNMWLFDIIIFIIALVVTLVFTQQITSMQRKFELASQESEERLRAFMDSATDGFFLFDSQLNYLDLNKVALATLGFTKEEMIGKNLLDLFPQYKESELLKQFKKVIKTGNPFILDPEQFRAKFYSVRAFRVGEGLGISTIDITEQKQAEIIRKELEERREKFIWMTSHELRTPLTVITGYFDFLEKHNNDLDQDRQEKIKSTIKSNLKRLEHLIDEVSLIAQFEQGIFTIQESAFNFSKFFREAKEDYKTLLGEGLEVEAPQLKFPLNIKSDLNRLRQVLDNVVNNAINHTHPEHRQIKLSLTISPAIIRIICTDNGAGIAPDNLERIFEQFISFETQYATAGTGIGLYLSRKIMEALRGSLTAQSQGIGHGSTFIVELPNIHPE